MKKLLVISAILVSLVLVCSLGATAYIETSGVNNLVNGTSVAFSGAEDLLMDAGYQPTWIRELAAMESCPAAVGEASEASSCLPMGRVCDPLYVPNAVCCPGLSCYKPYPGVPKFCL